MAALLADKRIALFHFPTAPAQPEVGPTTNEVNAALNAADRVFKDGTYLRATASDSITDPLLCGGLQKALGDSNYEGQFNVARFLDPNGIPVAGDDSFWDAVNTKGTSLWVGWRVGPAWDAKAVVDQEISLYQVITDNPQEPQSVEGYIKKTVPLAVQAAYLNKKVQAGTPPVTTYKLTFAPGGDDVTNMPSPSEVNIEAGDYTLPTQEPERVSYTFTGWSDGANTYDAGDTFVMPAEDTVLTATWER